VKCNLYNGVLSRNTNANANTNPNANPNPKTSHTLTLILILIIQMSTIFTINNKNSPGYEIAHVSFYAVRPEATRIR